MHSKNSIINYVKKNLELNKSAFHEIREHGMHMKTEEVIPISFCKNFVICKKPSGYIETFTYHDVLKSILGKGEEEPELLEAVGE